MLQYGDTQGAALQRRSSCANGRKQGNSRYHAGVLKFERALARELDTHSLSLRQFHSLMVLGRDLYRMSRETEPKKLVDTMARVAAHRVRKGFKPGVVLSVLARSWDLLTLGIRNGSKDQLKKLTLDYAGTA